MRGSRSFRLAAATLLAGALLLPLAGCSGDHSSGDSVATDQIAPAAKGPAARDLADGAAKPGAVAGDRQDAPAKAGVPEEAGRPEQGGDGQAEVPTKVDQSDRSIIYKGSIDIRVKEVDRAAERAGEIVAGLDGSVSGDQRTSDANRSRATLVLRVPSARFFQALKALSELGEEKTRSVQSEDVTEQLADLDSRIATARASVDRVRALLARAQTIGEIVSLESELTRRESDLESLQARLRRLSDLTAMSTVTVTLLGPEASSKPKPEPKNGFVAGLSSGWDALIGSLGVLLTVLGALLPWLIAGGVPIGAVWWLNRRRRQRSRGLAGEPEPATAAGQSPADRPATGADLQNTPDL